MSATTLYVLYQERFGLQVGMDSTVWKKTSQAIRQRKKRVMSVIEFSRLPVLNLPKRALQWLAIRKCFNIIVTIVTMASVTLSCVTVIFQTVFLLKMVRLLYWGQTLTSVVKAQESSFLFPCQATCSQCWCCHSVYWMQQMEIIILKAKSTVSWPSWTRNDVSYTCGARIDNLELHAAKVCRDSCISV